MAERLAASEMREREYREFFEKMDKDRNKIARAIREYRDPDTSERKRIKLRTYLRQTSIDTPEDRKLLKEVLLRFDVNDELTGDLQMALMHAIQQHPEDTTVRFQL